MKKLLAVFMVLLMSFAFMPGASAATSKSFKMDTGTRYLSHNGLNLGSVRSRTESSVSVYITGVYTSYSNMRTVSGGTVSSSVLQTRVRSSYICSSTLTGGSSTVYTTPWTAWTTSNSPGWIYGTNSPRYFYPGDSRRNCYRMTLSTEFQFVLSTGAVVTKRISDLS